MSRYILLALTALCSFALAARAGDAPKRPNILLAISDDQSWLHTSAAGCKAVRTPAFDRVAGEGMLFNNCMAGSPGCSPSRAALLTGRHHWMLEHAGTHASEFPKKYLVYPDALEAAGYFVGMTGKGWGPGNFQASGRPRNPAGTAFGAKKEKAAYSGIGGNDYAGNFADFLAKRPNDAPFCFWYGGSEPHRGFEKGSGLKAGKKMEHVDVPPFLPDTPEIRSDILDYLVEIEHFDAHLGRMLKMLEEAGELDNTLVIVTGDNGMAFPRAKANCYEYGIHVPLAIRWGGTDKASRGRKVDDVVGFVDLTATIYEATGVKPPEGMVGRSLMDLLSGAPDAAKASPPRVAFSGRERHSSSRHDNLGYPQRALRTDRYLYVRNFKPDRWPAGDPTPLNAEGKPAKPHSGYHDIDGAPSMDYLVDNREKPEVANFFQLAVAKRPAEELFDIVADPGCLKDLAADPAHAEAKNALSARMEAELRQTNDVRITGDGEIWETYKRYSPIRNFPPPPSD